MTIHDKINFLKKLRIQNIIANLLLMCKTGLCMCSYEITDQNLIRLLPELEKERTNMKTGLIGYWWVSSDESNFLQFWYERHKAINRTIKKLKKEYYRTHDF